MTFDSEHLAAIEKEQQRLIWETIALERKRQALERKQHADRERQRLKRKQSDYLPHLKRATARTPRITYAAHIVRHAEKKEIA